MSREDNDERRLYQCARKYEKIVKQYVVRKLTASSLRYWIIEYLRRQPKERKYRALILRFIKDRIAALLILEFDELMNARTRKPKRQRRVTSNSKGNSTVAAPPSEPDNEVFVQTITQFLKELQSDQATVSDCLTSTAEE